jgi:hypothetical protein
MQEFRVMSVTRVSLANVYSDLLATSASIRTALPDERLERFRQPFRKLLGAMEKPSISIYSIESSKTHLPGSTGIVDT